MEAKNALVGHIGTIMGWMLFSINPQMIPLILSSIASILGAINYYYSIKKNRQK